jgi:TIR domain
MPHSMGSNASSEFDESPRLGPRVFISYSFSNPAAKGYRDRLDEDGFAVELIEGDALLGEPSLAGALVARIEAADFVVPLVDAAAAASRYVRLEIEAAQRARVPVIPVLFPGVEPSGPLADVPCMVGADSTRLRDALRDRLAGLDFDTAAPAQLLDPAVDGLMRRGARAFVDPGRRLFKGMENVFDAIAATGHDGATAQARRILSALDRALRKLQEMALPYRAALLPHLEGWQEPNEPWRRSWSALTSLVVGRPLVELATMFPPGRNDAWGAWRDGMVTTMRQWAAIDEENPSWRPALWAIGRKTLPIDDWTKDKQSPCGDWRCCRARLHDGQSVSLLLPDSRSLEVSMKWNEPPERFLESWDWLYFVLPMPFDLHRARPWSPGCSRPEPVPGGRRQSRSNTAAMPCPPPMHIVTSA